MSKTLLTSIALLFLTNAFAQKREFTLGINSGLFSFSGQSAEKKSEINYDNLTGSGYTNNPYGAMRGLCYGVSVNLKRITKKNLVLGAGAGYENLRSKVEITTINGYTGSVTYQYSAHGKTFLNGNFINLNPFIGRRFNAGQLSFDITGGFDMAFCISMKEMGNATAANGTKYTTSSDRNTINTDVRARIQISASYKKSGIYLGYSYGLANYKAGYIGGTNECYARLIRFGCTYRVH